ncbi:hypothetical protein CJO71_30480 [Burkholderia ubonensis]|uniref:Uncharacterized protein n=1 Tax=Burkholderia ubonensis TaxID=101571 RepID=A0AB74DCN7_9BURK|nr:hypothetical protein CJO71_30480 [Burkholderia ubonensis]PAJ96656.1 hypothetical protein CJO68_33255 [Burkholderia ubonensis]RQP79139.1 hypothetical protein DF015_12030 [Burkholderia ubonensis]RQP95360.1 hypothetical protein DF012_13970 [Burkholderia ubonensis]
MIHVSVSFRSEDGNAFRMSAACATQREILTCALLSQIRHPLYIRMAKAAAAPACLFAPRKHPARPFHMRTEIFTCTREHSRTRAQIRTRTLDNL